jgi:hypothetical protein
MATDTGIAPGKPTAHAITVRRDKNASSTNSIVQRKIKEIDANGDGVIDEAELTRAVEEMLHDAKQAQVRGVGGWMRLICVRLSRSTQLPPPQSRRWKMAARAEEARAQQLTPLRSSWWAGGR